MGRVGLTRNNTFEDSEEVYSIRAHQSCEPDYEVPNPNKGPVEFWEHEIMRLTIFCVAIYFEHILLLRRYHVQALRDDPQHQSKTFDQELTLGYGVVLSRG